jgi:hypothetical protein
VGAPTILFDEFAALTALQQCITTAIPEVPQVDVYRARPSAAPSRWGLSVLLVPTTPLPVLTSYMGDQSTGTQQQLARFVFTTPAAGAWQARVLGQTSAAYVAGGGDTTTQIRNGVSAALALLGLPVTLTNTTAGVLGPGQAGLDVLADVAGASMLPAVSVVPAGGAASTVIVDDNLRRASFNWGLWTIRCIVRDVAPAGGTRPCMVGPYTERLRLFMQAGASIPVVNGSAFPYVQDRMGGASQVNTLPAGAAMNWRQTMGPFVADVNDNNTWLRGMALDLQFDTSSALYYDVPSLDSFGQVPVTI